MSVATLNQLQVICARIEVTLGSMSDRLDRVDERLEHVDENVESIRGDLRKLENFSIRAEERLKALEDEEEKRTDISHKSKLGLILFMVTGFAAAAWHYLFPGKS